MGLGVLLGLGASASWALANVYVQRASQAAGAIPALLWSQVVGILGIAVLVLLGLDPRTSAIGLSEVGWLVAGAVASLAGYLGIFDGFARAPLSLAVPIVSSWSFVAALVAIFIFGEHLRPGQALGGLFVVAGVIIVARFANERAPAAPPSGASRSRAWLPSVFAGALGFGFLIPIVDRLAASFGRLGSIGAVYAADILLALPCLLVLRLLRRPEQEKASLQIPPRAAVSPIVAAGVFETVGFICISLGVTRAPVALVSPLASLSSAFTVFFAWFWLRERPARPVLLGAALACAGVITLAL